MNAMAGAGPPRSGGGSAATRAGTGAAAPPAEQRFACEQCGALLTYQPGTAELVCAYCGHRNHIVEATTAIVENDLAEALRRGLAAAPEETTQTVKCTACAAEFTFDRNRHAGACPFCGSAIVADPGSHRQIRPAALLPMAIAEPEARQRLSTWLRGLWFAPSKLKEFARTGGRLVGVYLPYWTYDSRTETDYAGQRGTIYHERVAVRVVRNGRSATEMRSVQKVRWQPASGRVRRDFDDVLVPAAGSLPAGLVEALEPWDLQDLRPYTEGYLSGFQSETYQVPLDAGFGSAQAKMRAVITRDVEADIGGDLQRVDRLEVRHSGTSFKHVLLPVWLGVYRFGGRTYRLCINGRTGEVHGERPWSAWKLAGAVLLVLAIAATIYLLYGILPQAPRF
ncbi:MAG: hypothetical protein U1E14_13990 [Geminicoccaceae bacterium]